MGPFITESTQSQIPSTLAFYDLSRLETIIDSPVPQGWTTCDATVSMIDGDEGKFYTGEACLEDNSSCYTANAFVPTAVSDTLDTTVGFAPYGAKTTPTKSAIYDFTLQNNTNQTFTIFEDAN